MIRYYIQIFYEAKCVDCRSQLEFISLVNSEFLFFGK